MLQPHLNDQEIYCLLRCVLNLRLDGRLISINFQYCPKIQLSSSLEPSISSMTLIEVSGNLWISSSILILKRFRIYTNRSLGKFHWSCKPSFSNSLIKLNLGYAQMLSFPTMTSLNGNIFHITGPLCGEFTGHRWIPLTKASDAELWCFLWSASE